MAIIPPNSFWREACALEGSVTPRVLPHVLTFAVMALVVAVVSWQIEQHLGITIEMAVAPYEIAGAALSLLLVLRTNAGYERWWEGRKLWGGIVNQSRNLAIAALAYGPAHQGWRQQVCRWTAAFPYVARASLRGERELPEVRALLGNEAANAIASAEHMPSYVALVLGRLLQQGCEQGGMDRFAFLQMDRERAALIDHIGACERILKTPLPSVCTILIRRFIMLFLLILPFALVYRHGLDTLWLPPLITILVAYPLLALDQIGIQLQNPFSLHNLSHLPLNHISAAIEGNLTALLRTEPAVPSFGETCDHHPIPVPLELTRK